MANRSLLYLQHVCEQIAATKGNPHHASHKNVDDAGIRLNET